jgi:hypothetical protein
LDYAMMMALTTRAVASCGQGRGRGLEGGIVRDGKAPVRGQVLGVTGVKVTIRNRE